MRNSINFFLIAILDSTSSPEQNANTNPIHKHSLDNLRDEINKNNLLIIWMMIFIVVIVAGFVLYINRDPLFSALRRRQNIRVRFHSSEVYNQEQEPL